MRTGDRTRRSALAVLQPNNDPKDKKHKKHQKNSKYLSKEAIGKLDRLTNKHKSWTF